MKSQVQATTGLNPFCLLGVGDKVAVEIDHTQEVVEMHFHVEPKPVESPLPVEEPNILLKVDEKDAAINEPKVK